MRRIFHSIFQHASFPNAFFWPAAFQQRFLSWARWSLSLVAFGAMLFGLVADGMGQTVDPPEPVASRYAKDPANAPASEGSEADALDENALSKDPVPMLVDGRGVPIPVAIFAFREQGEEPPNNPPRFQNQADPDRLRADVGNNSVRGMGPKAASLLFAELATDPALVLVERDEIDKLIEELELSASGMIDSATSNRIGRMMGARILITGSVLKSENKLYVIAKIIGTETSRVFGASAKGNADGGLSPLMEQLAKDISKTLSVRGTELLPKQVTELDRIAILQKKLENKKLPTLAIKIDEQHQGAKIIDPAAETEFIHLCKTLGFTIYTADSSEGKNADVFITGEALSEAGFRKKNFYSVKGRLEVKAFERKSGKILHADRATVISMQLTERIAGKAALQEAALQLAETIIPKLVSGN